MLGRIRLNSWSLLAAAASLALLQMADPSPIWETLLIVLGGAVLVGWLWARGLARGLSLTREMRYGWAQVGDELEERFTLNNTSLFPATWVEIEDHSNMPGYQASMASVVGSQERNELTTSGECATRGLFILGGATLRSGDPLGIFTVEIEDRASRTLLVLPPVVPLLNIQVTPGGLLGDGQPRSNSPEKTPGAAGVREYQPGDPFKLIHWPTTARRGRPYVRLLDGTPTADWWLLVDLDQETQSGAGQDSTVEHALILAASLADKALKNRKAVGLALNGRQPEWLAPRGSEAQRWDILRSLALANPGPMNLGEFLKHSWRSFRNHASLVIITANPDPGWIESLAALQWRGLAVPTVLLLENAHPAAANPAAALVGRLQHMGISAQLIQADIFDRPETHPGVNGRWEWKISATGKAIPIHKPGDEGWSRLA